MGYYLNKYLNKLYKNPKIKMQALENIDYNP